MGLKNKYRYDLHKNHLELECLMNTIESYLEEGNDIDCKPYQDRYNLIVESIDRGMGERGLYEPKFVIQY
tara:strand:+ start:5473 stop:5682 length:210 start_codon:yes stop_codon:yes gene_type:complete